MKKKNVIMPARKRLCLIAHDNMKSDLIDWCTTHLEKIKQCELYATGTTGFLLEQQLPLTINKLMSGPLGGDQQIGALVTQKNIDIIIFFWDPFEPLPHDPDVKALLRVSAVWNIAVACNKSSADFMLNSTLMNQPYEYKVPDYEGYLEERLK